MDLENKHKLKRKQAAALKYDPDQNGAPVLVAKGKGQIAENIIKRAKQANVPIEEDPILVSYLCDLPLGEEIPPELYLAVAQVLAFIFKFDKNIIKSKG
jgi:flagellar biosynthesis protein